MVEAKRHISRMPHSNTALLVSIRICGYNQSRGRGLIVATEGHDLLYIRSPQLWSTAQEYCTCGCSFHRFGCLRLINHITSPKRHRLSLSIFLVDITTVYVTK